MDRIDLFSSLRRAPRIWQSSGAAGDVYFHVSCEVDAGAFVRATDAKGKAWRGASTMVHGRCRAALDELEAIQERAGGSFHWGGRDDRVSLAEHQHLVPVLAATGRLVDQAFKQIRLEESPARIKVALSEKEGTMASRPMVFAEDGTWDAFDLWSESYVLVEGARLFRIPSLGVGFVNLHKFRVQFPATELERFLTLLYSTVDGVGVDYENYREVRGPLRTVEPCVVFEDVDVDGNLKVRIGLSMAGFENEFVESYELSRAVTVNEMERSLVVGDVVYASAADCMRTVESDLKQSAKKVGDTYYQDENFFLVEPECARHFIEWCLPALLQRFRCFGAESLTRFRIRTKRPRLTIERIGSGIDFLAADVSLEFDDQRISLADALRHFKKQVYIPLNDGSRAVVNPDYLRKLERIFRRRRDGRAQVSFFDLPFVEELIDENQRQRLAELPGVKKIRQALMVEKPFAAAAVKAKLRPYQKTGCAWLERLQCAGLGGCLADDMGLGKTLQALAILRATARRRGAPPSLVVMPRTLLFNWQAEISRFCPDLTFAVHHGATRNLEQALKCNLVLTTYGTVRADVEQLKNVRFHYLILDESQNVKNPDSQTSRAVLLLQGAHRLALSGTPVENNLTELYSLFRFLNPSMFESLQAFNRDYALPIAKHDDRQAMRELRAKIAPFILRRTKKDVLKELPDKVEQILYVDMSPEQAELYENRRLFYRQVIDAQIEEKGLAASQFTILQAFTELRQIASTPESRTGGEIVAAKREVVLAELTEATANGHKCLLFANFLGALDSLGDDLHAAGIGHLVMTGATRDRESLVRRFQNDDSVQVFLMTLKTGGVGLNLTAADYVFIYDPWWNRAAETQAVDRTHRIGQKNAVFTYKLVTRHTIEERILELQERKRELFDNLVGADVASLKSFSVEEIRFALGVDA